MIDYTTGGSVITWKRFAVGPEVILPPQVLFSLDGSAYTPAGAMQRVSGGWRAGGLVPPLNTVFYLRTHSQLSSGSGNGSSGALESTRQFYVDGDEKVEGVMAGNFE
jgi:hypothetical protein